MDCKEFLVSVKEGEHGTHWSHYMQLVMSKKEAARLIRDLAARLEDDDDMVQVVVLGKLQDIDE